MLTLKQIFESKSVYGQMAAEARARKKAEVEKQKAEKKEAETKAKESKDEQLYNKVCRSVSDSYPDADPLDAIGEYLEKNNFDISDINRVFRKFAKCSFDKYVKDFEASLPK